MKKLTALFFAAAMMFSIVFIGDALSSNGSMSANAQTVTSRKKRHGVAHRTYRGGRWVTVKTWKGGKMVTRKVYQGGKMVTRKTTRGSKKAYRVTRHGGVKVYRKVVRSVN